MPKGPSWNELNSRDRQILAPLGPEWDQMDLLRKNKWLGVARRYPAMHQDEQQRVQERMQDWSRLSSQERQAAREKFKGLNQLPTDKRQDLHNKWLEYQNLPQEQRQALRQAPPTARPPSGIRPAPGSPPALPPPR